MDVGRHLSRSQDISNQGVRSSSRSARKARSSASPEQLQKAVDENIGSALTNPAAAASIWPDWYAYAVDTAQRSILFWDTIRQRGNDFVEHAQAGLSPVLHFAYETVLDGREFRPAGQLRARAHRAARRRHRLSETAAVRHHRSASRSRARDRRLQGRFAGRRRDARGPSRLFRHFFPRSRAGPDVAARLRGGKGVRAQGARAPSRQPETRDRRQLPGRLGRDDARRRRSRRHGADRHQRRADVVLGRSVAGRRRRQSDALRRRHARRHVARVDDGGPGRRRVRRRVPGRELRESQSGEHVLGQVLPLVRERRHRTAALSRVRALVGRLLPDEPRGDRVDHPQPVRRQQAVVGRHEGVRRRGLRSAQHQGADRPVRLDGGQHHAAAAGVQLGRGRVRLHRGDQGARPGHRGPRARDHRPPRDLRVRQGGEEGARADRLGAEVDRGAAAGSLRHGRSTSAKAATGRSSTRCGSTSTSSRTSSRA